jgi:hypothetical protein
MLWRANAVGYVADHVNDVQAMNQLSYENYCLLGDWIQAG